MKLSAYTDVCLRVLMTLAAAEGERLTSQQIADRIQVPYNHVIKAVAELRRRGTIEVLRGRHGGAMIAAAGLDQRVGELVRSLSSRDEVIDCAGRDSGVACPYVGDCRLRGALHRAREAFLAELDTVRIRDLVSAGPVGGPVLLGLPEIPVAH
ncbi:Rrf2 family transcriptional regulator [Micrococcus luteus]|nr:Rrf2 family transcriptional regulator [Micrococcus luteus]